MNQKKLILVHELCQHYEMEISFFEQVEKYGLVNVEMISDEKYIHRKQLNKMEKILRLHRELEVNLEGIDVIFNLMRRIQVLEKELKEKQTQLGLFENLDSNP